MIKFHFGFRSQSNIVRFTFSLKLIANLEIFFYKIDLIGHLCILDYMISQLKFKVFCIAINYTKVVILLK